MFSKGLSSLGQLAGSAAHVAKEKAQQAQLDQTAAVSLSCCSCAAGLTALQAVKLSATCRGTWDIKWFGCR